MTDKVSRFIYLFWVLRRFQHCTGHITTGSWKGRGNQYIQFIRVLYCKLPTNGKQLSAFPLEAMRGSNPGLRGGRRECYHSATVAPDKVSGKIHNNSNNVRDSAIPCVVPASPVNEDKYELQLSFPLCHRTTIAAASNVDAFKA